MSSSIKSSFASAWWCTTNQAQLVRSEGNTGFKMQRPFALFCDSYSPSDTLCCEVSFTKLWPMAPSLLSFQREGMQYLPVIEAKLTELAYTWLHSDCVYHAELPMLLSSTLTQKHLANTDDPTALVMHCCWILVMSQGWHQSRSWWSLCLALRAWGIHGAIIWTTLHTSYHMIHIL